MPEAFRKLLTSPETGRWPREKQEGVLNMCELFIELLTSTPHHHMMDTLALVFDVQNSWNQQNKDQPPRREAVYTTDTR